MEYTISNHRHYADFTIIPNEILRSQELTFFEKGLLCYLLSLPVNWEIKIGYIAANFGETERAILKAMKGLIEAGYCRRTARRENGRLSGQHYQITDIANNFSAPAKNEGAENSAPQNSRPTEIPAPLKNEGAEKENTLFDENISIKEEKRNTHAGTRERKCLFADSKFYDFDKFKEQFTAPEFAEIDIFYYYNRILNWSGGNDKRKNDWILTAKNWMMDDNEKGKLKKISSQAAPILSEAEIAYLNAMSN